MSIPKKNKIKIYLTAKQLQFLSVLAAFRCWVGGRGCGKSTAIGYSIMQKVREMPGSAGLLTCITIEQLKTNTLSSIKKVWKRHRIIEGRHYVCFIKPPKNWLINTVAPPDEFKNIIFFKNGTWIKCISAKMYNAARGGSYDWAEIDEAGFFPEIFYTEIIGPSIRGNRGRWDTFVHQQVSFYSSMPKLHKGKWLLKFETLMESDPLSFFFMEATAYDNIEVFGRENLDNLRKITPYLTFQVEYMNMRVTQADHQYYFAFSETAHLYGDIDPAAPNPYYNTKKHLSLTFDFGGWFSCLGVFQEYKGIEFGLNDYDATKKESLKDLLDKFVNDYASHGNKHIKVFGDPRGHDATQWGETSFEYISKYLAAHGWIVEICVQNTPADSHIWRHKQMNNVLSEDNEQLPKVRLHRHRCSDSIIAMQITEATPEFKKNKSKEKDRTFPQQHAPHHTDKLDYLIMQKYGHLFGLINFRVDNHADA